MFFYWPCIFILRVCGKKYCMVKLTQVLICFIGLVMFIGSNILYSISYLNFGKNS